ncbi:hypothetical protein B0H10DRAFT_2166863 [Mycena sp. CBHHK59/15]|nr:hypothetical protein B0H10DRAFT_2166863 [Mycena sp. CBHHK59/15]
MAVDAALCLACSSSLPPKSSNQVFTTRCCSRPICPSCTASNPRLARYDPCLACLGGVGVVSTRRAPGSTVLRQVPEPSTRNVDGAVRDEDTFILGDDEMADEDESESPSGDGLTSPSVVPEVATEPAPLTEENATPTSAKYYIKRGDSLQGISLRLGLDGRELCRLNNLPPSTLSTTPHLLHTRGFLALPPSAQSKLQASDSRPNNEEERARQVRRTRERAEKRLQTLTKEVDWRVAKAYLALADDPDEAENFVLKQKELGTQLSPAAASPLEAMAVDRYLDDLEWEANELREGRSMHIPQYPVQGEKVQSSAKTAGCQW